MSLGVVKGRTVHRQSSNDRPLGGMCGRFRQAQKQQQSYADMGAARRADVAK
jgi:hypothetical protein